MPAVDRAAGGLDESVLSARWSAGCRVIGAESRLPPFSDDSLRLSSHRATVRADVWATSITPASGALSEVWNRAIPNPSFILLKCRRNSWTSLPLSCIFRLSCQPIGSDKLTVIYFRHPRVPGASFDVNEICLGFPGNSVTGGQSPRQYGGNVVRPDCFGGLMHKLSQTCLEPGSNDNAARWRVECNYGMVSAGPIVLSTERVHGEAWFGPVRMPVRHLYDLRMISPRLCS